MHINPAGLTTPMLYFDCPHCGNHLRLEDEFAGRDGWCRACKGMIVAPRQGEHTPGIEALPLGARYDRLYQLFRFAATKADNYKLLLGRLRHQRDTLTKELAKAGKWRDTVTELQRQVDATQRLLAARDEEIATAMAGRGKLDSELAALRLECEILQNSLAEYRVAAVAAEPDAGIQDALAEARHRIEQLDETVARVEKEKAALQSELDASREAAAGSHARIAGLEQEAIESSTVLGRIQQEVGLLKSDLDDRDRQIASMRDAHERTVLELQHDAARLQERLDAAGGAVADEIVALEEELRQSREQAATKHARAQELELNAHAAVENATRLQRELQSATEAVAGLEQELHLSAENLQQSENALEAVRREAAAGQDERAAIQQERDALKNRVQELESALAGATEKTEAHAIQIADLEARLQDAHAAQHDLAAAMERSKPVVDETATELETIRGEREALQKDLDTLREDYALLEQEYEALQEELDVPSFGSLPSEAGGELLSPMPPAPTDANDADDRVIIPEIVMDEPERPDPMVNALLRFIKKERDNDEVG